MHGYNAYPLTFLGDLQTMYLIPRSASPISLEDRPEESLNREELLELLRRQKVYLTAVEIHDPQLTATDSPGRASGDQERAQA
jgi:hypothetical protein